MRLLNIILTFCTFCLVIGQHTNQLGKETILLQMPSTVVNYNRKHFYPMIRGLVRFAKSIIGKDNVIVMANKHTRDYLKRYLPEDILLESQISDLWLRDLAPIRNTFFKFVRLDGTTVQQDNMKVLLRDCTDKGKKLGQSRLTLDGGNLVHNGIDTAILTTKVKIGNPLLSYKEISAELRRSLNMSEIVLIPVQVTGEPTGHADMSFSFIDNNVLAYSDLSGKGKLGPYLQRYFGGRFRLVEIDSVVVRDSYYYYSTGCGIHINILATDRHLYVPMYGMDAENRRRKQSMERDMEQMRKIAANTRKIVVPIPIPFTICRLGGGPRCLTWQTKGALADDLVIAARKNQCFRDFRIPFRAS